jgi:DNA-binding MarR family transcriptional regulator
MTNDELYALALEARILTGAMMRLVRGDLDRRLQPHGIGGWLQHATMSLLVEYELTITELSKHLRVEPATLVPVIDALEREGLVRRGSDPNDRRRTPLSLTERGAEMIRQVPTVHPDDVMLAALRDMGPAKSRQYVDLLRELMQHMSNDQAMVQQIGEAARRQIARERKARRGGRAGDQSPAHVAADRR